MIVSRIRVLYAMVATAFLSVNGQTKHIIKVGVSGNGFEPPTVVVGLNDIVVFVFGGDFYTVTQSTFENPFVPLPGGFSSGLANGSVLASTWELRVTDVLHPIWFFCKDTQPSPLCAAGTVGSINPPNKAMHNIFASAAKQIPCSPTPTSTATFTGHSALATNSSATVPASVNTVPSGTPPPTQASFANDNPTETSSITAVPVPRRRRGVVIGGVVAGILGLLAILLAAGLCWLCRLRRRSRAQRDIMNPFRTREAKLNSNTLYFRPEATTPPQSASTDKRASPQLNADGIPASLQDSPSFGYLGGQQAQNQPQPQQQPDSTSAVPTSPSEENRERADPAGGPSTISGSSPDGPHRDPMVFARPKEVYREQQPEQSTSCAVPMSSKEESVRSPSTISSSPDRQSPVFFESPEEVYEGDLPPSTYRTAMGARLREVIRAEEAHPEYGTVIGIDLGTTYSSVGVQRGGVFEIIPNDQGQQTTPSWVCFTDKKRLVGEHAKKAFRSNPSNTVFAVKRLIGRKMDDRDIVHDMKRWPFRVSEKNGKPAITVKVKGQEKSFTPEEITAMILRKMKETAEAFLRHTVTHAVVTVPACFNDAQRQATKDAGRIAGLEIVRIINEPTAAAIAYGLKRKGVSRVIVYDLGGGFFDVSLLSIDDGVFEVLATAGNTRLGGEDFDNRVMDYLIKHYKRKTGTDVSQNLLALAKLKCEVEKAKCTLSSQHSAQIEIESETGNKFSETLTRAKFEELNIDLFQKTVKLVEQVLKDANCEKIEIDAVLLAGGSTRIPKVQELLKEFFGGKEPSKEVNPDDAIVRGAAVQGGVLSGSETAADIILVDVCPHTLGIEIVGGVFARLIPRNTVIPTKKSGPFTTVDDNQSSVLIAVFEGEHSQIKYNNLLGMFELSGIPPAPAGVPVIEVTFEIDANGIMQVRAADKGTGNSKSITIITNKGRLSQEEIMRMLADAGRFTAEGEASHK